MVDDYSDNNNASGLQLECCRVERCSVYGAIAEESSREVEALSMGQGPSGVEGKLHER